jgi:hypothetical protein
MVFSKPQTPGFVNYKKGALDLQPQVIKFTSCLLAHGRWFSPDTLASSTTKTGHHDIRIPVQALAAGEVLALLQ